MADDTTTSSSRATRDRRGRWRASRSPPDPPIMEDYAKGASARAKADGSPVTRGRRARRGDDPRRACSALAPEIAVVAEEAVAAGAPIVVARRASSSSIRSTARANSSPATANSPSTRRWSSAARRSPARSMRRRSDRLWFARRRGLRLPTSPVGADLPPPSAWRPLRVRAGPAGAVGAGQPFARRRRRPKPFSPGSVAERISAGSSLKFCVIAEGAGRRLSALRADDGMGHRGGRRGAARRGRRRRSRVDGAPLRYGKLAAGLRNGGFRRLGRSERRGALA